MLNKDNSLTEKIRMLYQEQGITIASILTAIGMAIDVLVEALIPSVTVAGGGTVCKPPHKDKKGLKEWIRNKLKALASLLGRLGVKAAEVLPGITGAIISWTLHRAADVMGWVLQNLWALVIGIGGLLYKNHITTHRNIIYFSKYHKTPPIPVMLKVMNASSLSCCSLLEV